MSEMTLFTDKDLMENQEAQTEPAETAEEALCRAKEDLEYMRQERNKLKTDCASANKLIAQLKAALRKERELRLIAERDKPVALPALGVGACAVVAILTFIATDRQLMVDQLGDILDCFFIGAAAFFVGMIWERCDPLKRMKGGTPNGNG